MIDWGAMLSRAEPAAPEAPPPPDAAPEPAAPALSPIRSPERSGDNRRRCSECSHRLPDGRCLAAIHRAIVASRAYVPNRDTLRRCEGFAPLPDDPDQRPARDRWPGLD